MKIAFGNTTSTPGNREPVNRELAIKNFNRVQEYVDRYLDYMDERHGPNGGLNSHIGYFKPEGMGGLAQATGVALPVNGMNLLA